MCVITTHLRLFIFHIIDRMVGVMCEITTHLRLFIFHIIDRMVE